MPDKPDKQTKDEQEPKAPTKAKKSGEPTLADEYEQRANGV